MSEQDFEVYLTLLCKMLRLTSSQRDEIQQELRDHLEHRLGDLLEAGHTREQAIKLALEEFGDAAGLASQFVSINQQQRKRWMMRFATLSVAVFFLAAVFIYSFWPEGGRVELVQQISAQADDDSSAEASEDEQADAADSFSPDTEEDNNRATEKKLSKFVGVDFYEESFTNVIDYLRGNAEVEFYADPSAMEESGVTTDHEVSMSFQRIRLSVFLEIYLHELDLDYVVRDGIVLITTPGNVVKASEIRVYDCTDLVGIESSQNQSRRESGKLRSWTTKEGMDAMEMMMADGMGNVEEAKPRFARYDNLVSLIQETVYPDSWAELGGPGSINLFQGLLVINNNAKVHRQTAELLEKIRQTKHAAR